MSFHHWLAFAASSSVLLTIPGPTIILVVSYALGHGRRAALSIVLGVALGDLTAMTASMLGLGALLATSATVFTILRLIGGLYLIYLGIKLWRAPVAVDRAEPETEISAGRMFAHTYAVTALNPKSIVFFIAFVPQFLVSTSPFWLQALILETSFVALATLNAGFYALLAATARQRLRQPRVRRMMNRTGGSMLIGAGALALSWRNAKV